MKEGRPWHKYKDELIKIFNMYSFCDRFAWCSPEVYESMDENIKAQFLMIMQGEADGGKEKEK